MKVTDVSELEKIAKQVRIDVLNEVYTAHSGHIGGAFSVADILTVLYFNEMNINPEKPKDQLRDRFVLSKGHASAAFYAVLAERGYFPRENLKNFRKLNGHLEGHPCMEETAGVDMTTGSLGQGFSTANGMALASKMDKLGNRVYCIVGDGEIEEGQIWEAAMLSSQYKLDNLCLIVDCNNLQLSDKTSEIMGLNADDIENKFRSFGFFTTQINGNDISSILSAFEIAKNKKGMPTCIIARTIKGKGVSFMENNVSWHGKAPTEDEYKKALEELSKEWNKQI